MEPCLPILKKHYCPVCEAWIKNSSLDDREAIFIHKDIIHPANAMNLISQTEYNN